MDLGQIERAVEMRALPRGVPGRSRGQLPFLEERDLGPALEREMIGEADTHDAAADDHHARLRIHRRRLSFT